jgi:uncharacterized membrane protein YphA (DoxX/SURF4 family)
MAKMDAKSVGVWILCVIVGLFFLAGGIPKVMQTEQMVKSFEGWGYSSGFVLMIGLLEALGGLMLLVPRLAFWGGGMLVVVMAGAVYTHISTGIGSPVMAIVALALAGAAGFLRKDKALMIGRD